MDRPSITIDLPHFLQDFVFHESKQDRRSGELIADGTTDIGRMIQAMITVSDRPRKQEIKDSPFIIHLPVQEWNHAIFAENFLYIPEWKQKQLRMYIESQFRLRVNEFFSVGYDKGFKQERIIHAFLQNYNIKHNSISYDMVKKIDYRHRRKIKSDIAQEIQMSLFD